MENEKRDYNMIAKILGMALIDDFRGFLIDGIKRVTVPDYMKVELVKIQL